MNRLQQIVDKKRILFIAPKYFGYEDRIIEEFQNAGAAVDFIQENIDATTTKFLLLNKFPESIRNSEAEKYFIKKIKGLEAARYDFVFCIHVDLFSDKVFEVLKAKYPDAKYILHYWDSCKRMRNAADRVKHFEKVSTFDGADSKELGWKLRPLFFIPSFAGISDNANKKIDIIYIATLSRERAAYYKKLKAYCEANGISLYAKFYVRKLVWNLQKNKFEEYAGLTESELSFTSIPMAEIQQKMKEAKVMFDCNHSAQTGLTMRTIECVGAKLRLATTNLGIAEYDFYNEDNFYLIRDDQFEGLAEFVKNGSYKQLPDEIYEKYSLNYWLYDIFEGLFV